MNLSSLNAALLLSPTYNPLTLQFNMPSKIDWHAGETAMHDLLHVPPTQNPTSPGLPQRYHHRLIQSPLLAIGTLDEQGRPWTTLWGGFRGSTRAIAEDTIAVQSKVGKTYDPVYEALWSGNSHDDQDINKQVRMVSGLAVDLEMRDRVKLGGKFIAGAAVADGQIQAALHIEESLGNCPKYLNKKAITEHGIEGAKLHSSGTTLSEEAVELVHAADCLFVSSVNEIGMDTNHRGGEKGFVRVLENDEGGSDLVYPEFSGNRLYQTLGNLHLNPKVGMIFPNFDSGDVLFVTGEATILIGNEALALLPRTKVAVKISITDARFVKSGLPFRGEVIDYSPYNPPVRYLIEEQPAMVDENVVGLTASLVKRDLLTPKVARYTFELSDKAMRWESGQHVTFDFSEELDSGWSHMNNADPQSLNDDYVRTFTVSSPPSQKQDGSFEITVRKHGPATSFLSRRNLRAPLELPVLGFGGEEKFRMKRGEDSVFVAGGVGITPVLAQAGALLLPNRPNEKGSFQLLWSLRGEDLGLAVDSFERIKGLAAATTLFITGQTNASHGEQLAQVDNMDARVLNRRLGEDSLKALMRKGLKFYLCAAPGLLGRLNEWLSGEDVVWEDFGY